MKKYIILFLGVTGILGYAGAQQITNASFEQWDTIGDYTNPSNWYSLNGLSAIGYDPSTTITTDAHDGQYAVVLESKSGQFNDYTGLLCTGPILSDELQPSFDQMKVAFAHKPTAFSFYYKSLPVSGDTALIVMCLTKWNVANQRSDTVALASGAFGSTVTTYTQAVLPFDYILNTTPDSMFIIATSSADGFNPTVGSIFMLDNLQLSYGVGVNELNQHQLLVYPNPAQNQITIEGVSADAVFVLRDITGKQIKAGMLPNRSFDVTYIANGVYILEVGDQGKQYVRKIHIQH